jgi:UDP-N-acetylmuramate dehydrogenase
MTNLQTQLQQAFPDFPWQFDFALAQLTYFKIGGPAEAYLELTDAEAVAQLIKWVHVHQVRLTMLGGASNVIVADEGISGVVLHLAHHQLIDTGEKIGEKHIVQADTGMKMAALVSQTVNGFGLTGLEYFLGVPGTLGGAVYNNSHYLSHLIGEHIHQVQIITHDGEIKWLNHEECEFGYDTSRFHRTKEVIFAVRFALMPGDKAESLALIKEATEYRANTQPLGIPNSGCIFQNTPNTPHLQQLFPQFAERSHVPGGFLIDKAGLKGERVGDIEVSHKHAAFFVNHGQGTAQDVKTLMKKVQERVKDKFGVELQTEVFYLS